MKVSVGGRVMGAGRTASTSQDLSWPVPRDRSVSWGKRLVPSWSIPRGLLRMSRIWLTVQTTKISASDQ